MREANFEQEVQQPADVAWRYLSDLRNDPSWRTEIRDSQLVSGTAGASSATYRETVDWEGIEAEILLTVTESVPGARAVVTSDDPSYRSTSIWTFTESDTGCLVALHFSMETTGALRLIEPFMWGIVTRWLENDLPRLGDHIEARPPVRTSV